MKTRFISPELHREEASSVSYYHSLYGDPDILNSGYHPPLELGQNDHLELHRLFVADLDFGLIRRMNS